MVGLFPLSEEKKLKNDISHILMYLPALMGIGFSHCSRIILPLVRLCR